ncbi:anionic trypsin-2-like [Centruroides sculpturatus]|uniref:anionic trypsin-2-like n=1 Tax=Centruroides sculpturatus TaxID=218467 RepID=UPI000C6D27A4|nr:anionic trypsin-2-like [Centruroides sculpturatus]
MLRRERFPLYVLLIICYCSYTEQHPEHYLNDKRPVCLTGMEETVNQRKTRMIGGFPAADRFDQMRFVAEIHIRGKQSCLASVITDRHLLTAAHCLYDEPDLCDIILIIGDFDISTTDELTHEVRFIEYLKLHPKFDEKRANNDIAVIGIDPPVHLGKDIKAAVLPPLDAKLPIGTMCTIWGWQDYPWTGYRNDAKYILHRVDIPLLPKKRCRKNYSFVNKTKLCAGGLKGKDVCKGESGGSLLVWINDYYVICGIVSAGIGCGWEDVPGIYADVSRYTEWIYENTKDAACKPSIHPNETYPRKSMKKKVSITQQFINENKNN